MSDLVDDIERFMANGMTLDEALIAMGNDPEERKEKKAIYEEVCRQRKNVSIEDQLREMQGEALATLRRHMKNDSPSIAVRAAEIVTGLQIKNRQLSGGDISRALEMFGEAKSRCRAVVNGDIGGSSKIIPMSSDEIALTPTKLAKAK